MITKITMRKERATWHYFAHNAQGGGFGSNHCGTKRVALASAARAVQPGQTFALVTNGRDEGQYTKTAEGAIVRVLEPVRPMAITAVD